MHKTYSGARAARIFSALTLLGIVAACPAGKTEAPPLRVHVGDLLAPQGKDFAYVRGNVLEAKKVSIEYLEGDVRGEKIRGLWVNVMRGTVANGPATVNILHGDIIDGEGVTVNILIGQDFSGKARIGRRMEAAGP